MKFIVKLHQLVILKAVNKHNSINRKHILKKFKPAAF
jgi:hypothetical protein